MLSIAYNACTMKPDNDRNLDTQQQAHSARMARQHPDAGQHIHADSYRQAFSDTEFLMRREFRGIRLQLELLKPEFAQQQHQIDHTVVVYGSARMQSPEAVEALLETARQNHDTTVLLKADRLRRGARYYEDARAFARIVAQYSHGKPRKSHFYICTGGGPGFMEAANRGASEAGEPTIGLNITLPHEQTDNPYVTPGLRFKFHYFALRKMHFMMRAKALVTFPGGYGTLDELFEVLTLVQTEKTKPVPVVLYGSSYWKRLLHLDVLVEEGAIAPEDIKLFRYADTPEQAWEHIAAFYRLA